MTQERILPAAAAPASRPLLPSRSLARHLVIRLMPPILLLVLLDLIATWVITHKIEMSMWMLEDFLWLMVLGQIVLDRDVHLGGGAGRALGPALGESSVRRDPPALHRRHAAAGSGRRAGRDRAAGHAHQRPAAASGRLTGGAAALHRPCGPSVAHAAVRPAAGVRADAGAAAAGRCARGPSAHQGGQRPHDPPGPAIVGAGARRSQCPASRQLRARRPVRMGAVERGRVVSPGSRGAP